MVYSKFLEHPILCVAFGNDATVFAGLATGEIIAIDVGNDQSGIIGTHESPIANIFWIQ